jgi:hypothetical protein
MPCCQHYSHWIRRLYTTSYAHGPHAALAHSADSSLLYAMLCCRRSFILSARSAVDVMEVVEGLHSLQVVPLLQALLF